VFLCFGFSEGFSFIGFVCWGVVFLFVFFRLCGFLRCLLSFGCLCYFVVGLVFLSGVLIVAVFWCELYCCG